MLTVLIDHCTRVLPLYTRDSTILTLLIDHCTRGSTPYTRDSTILTVLIDHCTRGSTSLYPRLYHSNSVNKPLYPWFYLFMPEILPF
jgi:hypothetical protein